MQPCNRIYYSTVHWRLNVFRAAYRSSSEALTVFANSSLHTHVVTGRSQVWVGTAVPTQTWLRPTQTWLRPSQVWVRTEFPLWNDYCRSPHAYVNQRLQIQLELMMMSGMPLETCWAFNERWNNKFYYKVASCWLFLLSHTTMHGSMNIKFLPIVPKINAKWEGTVSSLGKFHIGRYQNGPDLRFHLFTSEAFGQN
jgi:hypothetical protein